MEIPATLVKELREKTGAGIMDCKRALVEAGGDMARAEEILRQQGYARAEKKIHRVTLQGIIDAYIHAGGRIGALIEVNCETDFVARTDDFRTLVHDLAMQVAATNPKYIRPEEAQPDEDPSEVALLAQPFIKQPTITVEQLIKQYIAKLGENIQVRRFARFELGV